MSPKSKAKELVEKFADVLPSVFYNSEESKNYPRAKQCAIIAINEILQINWYHSQPECFDDLANEYKEKSFYWNEVKEQIEKL
jgi:hypothetical protein